MNRFRFFDIFISFIALTLLFPFLIIIFLIITLDSKGAAIFRQVRVGLNNADFVLFKFRTMFRDSGKKSSLTIGDKDARITKVGYFLRKWKLDELPQLWNVFIGDMSMVGPRPELRRYVNYYTPSEMEILKTKPGITDYASLHFRNEAKLLSEQQNPEEYYIKVILPKKITLNKYYIQAKTLKNYFRILFTTILSIIKV